MSELKGACIIGQSGGPTAVINASVLGAVKAALNAPQITRVYGAAHGITGVLNQQLYDMGMEDPAELELLKFTPSSALGTCRYKMKDPDVDPTDYEKILETFRKFEYTLDCEDTVAAVLAFFARTKGDPMHAAILGANLGGDTDTIGALAAAICGAYSGTAKLDMDLIRQIEEVNHVSFREKSESILTFISNTYNNKVN